ncbi:MAG: 5'-methylthioadenosine/adenosylhomocysteine nucleosidase [Muribaculaceae bacterium]|nr:5'-methylthioadenosine/adenosylhomocysteine nucleosidase [Muribaculaceae bacterium]
MKIGIIVAMDKEMSLLLPMIKNESKTTINDTVFHTGSLGRHDVIAVKCGIGKVNAAIKTMTLIENFHPRLIINTGVAGGTGHGAGVLDVVLASEVAYHDVWCGPGTEPGQAADCPPTFVCPLDDTSVEKLGLGDIKRGLVASGDIFVSHPEDVERILELYPEAMAVDMESGAIAQVCYLKNVPFLCLRVISDTPGAADNIAQYENFWEDAPRHTFETLNILLAGL